MVRPRLHSRRTVGVPIPAGGWSARRCRGYGTIMFSFLLAFVQDPQVALLLKKKKERERERERETRARRYLRIIGREVVNAENPRWPTDPSSPALSR